MPGPVVRAPRGSQAGGCLGFVLLEAKRPQKASVNRGVRCRGASPASPYQGARPSARHGVKARGILDRWRQEKAIASETAEPSQARQPPRVEPQKVSPDDDSPCSTECVRQIYTGTSACLSAVVSPACWTLPANGNFAADAETEDRGCRGLQDRVPRLWSRQRMRKP